MDPDVALPVEVDADRRLQALLVEFVEGTLGWQVTGGGELPPALRLAGVVADPPRPSPAVPTILLVRDDDPPHLAALAAGNADLVLRWPDERHRLAVDGPALAERRVEHAPSPTVVFGGARGGVGTTTVMLAVGGLLAWAGTEVLAVGTGDVPAADTVVAVAPTALAAHRAWEAATAVPGVSGLRVVQTAVGPRPDIGVPASVTVLRDDGVTTAADVLVAQRDRLGVDAAASTAAAVIVLVDHGPLDARSVRSAAAGRPVIVVPWSSRVARAGALRRVPASLPGRWLRALAPLARSIG